VIVASSDAVALPALLDYHRDTRGLLVSGYSQNAEMIRSAGSLRNSLVL